LRDSGRWEEAIALAEDAARQLLPYLHADHDVPEDWHAMVGALEAEVAYVWARRGRHGLAWRHWENAEGIARRLRPGYRHVQSSFSRPVMSAHAVTLGVELQRPGEALRAADSLNPESIPSLPRRSRHLIEVARGHYQRGEGAATWAMLNAAERTAPETIRYNRYARDMLLSLRDHPPTGLTRDVRDLCQRVGLAS
jgi:hypothetical protein